MSWLQGLSSEYIDEEDLLRTRDSYLENCLHLGNLYLFADTKKEWELALPYYRMSQEPGI